MMTFIQNTGLDQVVYRPWTFGVTPTLQSIFYLIKDNVGKKCRKLHFDRELLTLSDGGTGGIDWNMQPYGSGRPSDDENKPILLLYPGISGCNNNLYTLNIGHEAHLKGFKVGTVIFRGADIKGVPITSGKFSSVCAWQDGTEITKYVTDKYVMKGGKKMVNLYAYACSLGAQILVN
jgi:predicted alpha/beta-fold hydrolase